MKLTSPTDIKDLMKRYDLHFNKRFGQNFLIDQNIVDKIADAAGIGPEDLVIEIGPGIGTLTEALADRANKVIAIEIDKKLNEVLGETLEEKDNVEIINKDVLEVDIEDLIKDNESQVRIAANLPYYITTPIILKFLESGIDFSSMTFLVQKEVADRLAAEPGGKEYGSLSVIAQYYADIINEFDVPASVFMPRPKVDSSLVKLTLKDESERPKINKENYFKTVKAAFGNRRKTLLNSLSSNLNLDKNIVREKLEAIDIDPSIRAEKLSPTDFERITTAFF